MGARHGVDRNPGKSVLARSGIRRPRLTVRVGGTARGRRQLEETFERSEQLRTLDTAAQRHRELLSAIPDTIIRINESGRILELHGEHNLSLQLNREDVLFRSVEVFSEEWQADLLALARSARESGAARSGCHHVELNGAMRTVESRVSFLDGRDAIVIARIVEGASIGPI